MNPYGLPEFVAYALLVGIACVLLDKGKNRLFKYWLLGWIVVLIHASIFMLLPYQFPYDVIGRGTLIVAGQCFLLASYYHTGRARQDRTFLAWFAVWCLLSLAFQLYATAVSDARADDGSDIALYALTVLCALAAFPVAMGAGRDGKVLMALASVGYLIQLGLFVKYDALMASQWQMGVTYFAVAYFFVRTPGKLTIGAAFTALNFVLWGLVFPVYAFLMLYAPDVGGHIEAGVWNLPKFLVAASMNLMLLQEKIAAVTHLATHDQLTGLPNRRLCDQRFDEAMTSRGEFGLLIVDLNRFKVVNDTMGHQAGDELLQAISKRFSATLRQSDIVARTGGDEFTAILANVRRLEDADAIGAKLIGSLAEPIMLQGKPYQASASIGAAIYPHDGASVIELSAAADQRMYAHKSKIAVLAR